MENTSWLYVDPIFVLYAYTKYGFTLTAFSDANWGNNPENGKLMPSYIVFLSNVPSDFKVGLLGLIAQFTMEEELLAVVQAFKEAVFCSKMMKELGFGTRFDSVPLLVCQQHLGFARRQKPDLQFSS